MLVSWSKTSGSAVLAGETNWGMDHKVMTNTYRHCVSIMGLVLLVGTTEP